MLPFTFGQVGFRSPLIQLSIPQPSHGSVRGTWVFIPVADDATVLSPPSVSSGSSESSNQSNTGLTRCEKSADTAPGQCNTCPPCGHLVDSCTIATPSSRKHRGDSSSNESNVFRWTGVIHQYFISTVFDLGLELARPKKVYFHMRKPSETGSFDSEIWSSFTITHVKSHLQRYRANVHQERVKFLTALMEILSENATGVSSFNQAAKLEPIQEFFDGTAPSEKRFKFAVKDTITMCPGRKRFRWSDELHYKFMTSIFELGLEKATGRMLFQRITSNPNLDALLGENHDAVKSLISKITLNQIEIHLRQLRKTKLRTRQLFVERLKQLMIAAKIKCTGNRALNPEFRVYPCSLD